MVDSTNLALQKLVLLVPFGPSQLLKEGIPLVEPFVVQVLLLYRGLLPFTGFYRQPRLPLLLAAVVRRPPGDRPPVRLLRGSRDRGPAV